MKSLQNWLLIQLVAGWKRECRLLEGCFSSTGSGELTELWGADSQALPKEALSMLNEVFFFLK